MRRLALVAIMLVATFSLSVNVIADETKATSKPWFDMDNCAMCKHLTAEDGLLDNMNWENHIIGTGMMSVCQVADGYEEKYAAASAHMEETSKALMSGEQLNMCGMCESMGALFASGKVTWEKVVTDAAKISLMTSTDASVIAQIKEHCQTTNDEYKKMTAAQSN